MFIVKVPGIKSTEGKTRGCEKAGNAIIEAMKTVYSNEEGKPIDVGLLDLEEIHLDNSNVELSDRLIYKNAFEIFETKPKTAFLGGDHSVTYPLARAFLNYCTKQEREPCIIILDAHPDCKKGFSNRGWLRTLVENGFPTEKLLLVGVRNQELSEIEFISRNRIRTIGMNLLMEDLADVCDTIMEFSNGRELYISLDIDAVDPAFAPGTENPEPGGLSSRQLIYLIQRFNKMKNLRVLDIVEINPEKIGGEETVKLGAKILSELV